MEKLIIYSKDPNGPTFELEIPKKLKHNWYIKQNQNRPINVDNIQELIGMVLGDLSLSKIRWPEIEPYILKCPNHSYSLWYAQNVIKGRWPEAEPYIIKYPEYASKYAQFVLRSRWPEAEQYMIIKPKSKWWRKYISFLIMKGIIITRLDNGKIILEMTENKPNNKKQTKPV